jgi:hypothetical protein
MEQEKALRLLLRQIKDIQAQADRILTGENSSETLESFAKYSVELKDYIVKNVNSDEVKVYLAELPDLHYSRIEIQLWQYLIFPTWWISLYKDYEARNRTIEEIKTVRGKYSSLELIVKGLTT